jgi:hypothetical protein
LSLSVLLLKSPSETLRILDEVYGKAVKKRRFMSDKRFHDDCASFNDTPGCRRPSTLTNVENIECVCNVVQSDL